MTAPRIASLGLIGALALSPLVASTAFAANAHTGHLQHPATAHPAKARPAKAHPAKAQHTNNGKRPTPFTATGVVTSVDPVAGTVTLADKGGSRDLHGTSVTVTVPAGAGVEVDDVAASLGDVVVGDHVAANGLRSAGPVFTARHVNAESADTTAAGTDPVVGSTDPTDPVDTGSTAPVDGSTPTAG